MSSRYLKDLDVRRSKIIHVYRNGDPYTRALLVILRLPEQIELERIIKAIEEKVKLPLNRPIRKLFELSGTLVQSHTQIEDGKYYVAASSENFVAIEYGHPANWVLVGPVRTSKYANVHYVTKAEEEGKPNHLSASSNVLSTNKRNKSSTLSKKSSGKKNVQSLKKEDNKKKQKNKMMFTSEHVDNILDDRINISINQTNDQITNSEPKVELTIPEPQNECDDTNDIVGTIEKSDSGKMTQENKIDDLEINQIHDKLHLSLEVTPEKETNELNPNENLSNFQDPTTINVSNEVFDNTDINENENLLEESKNDFDENFVSKDFEDGQKLNQNEIKEVEDETERDVIENLPQDPCDDNQMKQDELSEDVYIDAATKIQATFRGYRVRNELEKASKSEFPDDSIDENPDLSEATNNAEENI